MNRKSVVAVLSLSLLLLLSVSLASADLTPEQLVKAQALIEQFTNPEFAVRQEAVEKLIKMGPAVLPFIKKTLAETEDKVVKQRCRLVIDSLSARQAVTPGSRITFKDPVKLGEGVNSRYHERYPFISADGKTMYFSSDRPGGFGSDDLYVTHKVDDVWQSPSNLGPLINSPARETAPMLSHDGSRLFFVSARLDYPRSAVFVSRIVDGKHQPPHALPYFINAAIDTDDPFLTADGKMLYFQTCNRIVVGKIGELWCSRVVDGLFQPPVNAGPALNRFPGQRSPSLTAEGRFMFFVCHLGYRRTGIVMSEKVDGEFQAPKVIDFSTRANLADHEDRLTEDDDRPDWNPYPTYPPGHIAGARISWDGGALYFSMKDDSYDIWYAERRPEVSTRTVE